MSRYRTEAASARVRRSGLMSWWRVKARVIDTVTDETIDVCKRELADELADLLVHADEGTLPRLPSDAPPFRAYEVWSGEEWYTVFGSSMIMTAEPLARTRSHELATRVCDVLNRAHPRTLKRADRRIRAGWF